jgi:hypothetical protein
MTNWNHVANDMARNLLEGRVFADKKNLDIVLNKMLDEQSLDASNPILPEEIWWGGQRHWIKLMRLTWRVTLPYA